jgi:galactose-1-phosphate uridylyltransferase
LQQCLADYLALELQRAERLVYENAHFVAPVPFRAVWPFETLVVSRRHIAGLDESATVRKFMMGFEPPGMPRRDLTPEQAARTLRELPARHYLD